MFAMHPHGSTDAVDLATARELLAAQSAPGYARLSAVLCPVAAERVLDADTEIGMSALWRSFSEVERGWMWVRTPRGMHVWQRDLPRRDDLEIPDINRLRPMAGGDVKVRGFVIWPDGVQRWPLTLAHARDMLAGRFGPVPAGMHLISGQARIKDPDAPMEEAYGDPAAVHAGLLRVLEGSEGGERNNLLNWACYRARTLLVHHGWPAHEVAESFYRAGLSTGLAHGETERTVRSGLGIGADQWAK